MGFLGPNGAGKPTTIRLLPRFGVIRRMESSGLVPADLAVLLGAGSVPLLVLQTA